MISIIDIVPGVIRGISKAIVVFVKDIISTLLSWLGSLFRGVVKAWAHLVQAAIILKDIVVKTARGLYTVTRFVMLNAIPHAINFVFHKAATFALQIVKTLRDWAESAFRVVAAFAQRIVNALEDWARAAVHFLTTTINEAWVLLRKTAHLVFNLLDSAEHLAIWAIGAIWRELLKLFVKEAEAIARFLFKRLLGIALASAHILEKIITDVF